MMKERRIKLESSISVNARYTQGDKPVVLFLHFSGGTSHMWDGILPQFLHDYEVIAPDLRGHGRSDRPETGYHIDDMADDIHRLLEALDVAGCHVVGSSLGAEVGLSLAASHPEKVLSLVCEGALYNEFGKYGRYIGDEQEIAGEKARRKLELPRRKVPVCPTKESYLEEVRIPFEQHGLRNPYVEAYLESTVEENAEGMFTSHYENRVRSEYIEKYWDVRFQDYYRLVRCPILFMPSEEEWNDDRIRTSMEAFRQLAEPSEVARIPNSIHAYVWMQLPEAAGQVAKSYIDQVQRELSTP